MSSFMCSPLIETTASDMAQVERQEQPARPLLPGSRSQGGVLDWQQRPKSLTPPIEARGRDESFFSGTGVEKMVKQLEAVDPT